MLDKISNLIDKPSTGLFLAISVLCLLLLESGIAALSGGLWVRGLFDLSLVALAQYQFWTEWKKKVDA